MSIVKYVPGLSAIGLRRWAVLRRQFPLIVPLFGLLVGQIALFIRPSYLWMLLCVVLCGLFAHRVMRAWSAYCMVGIISAYAALPAVQGWQIGGEREILVRVVHRPRYPKIQQVRFDLTILAQATLGSWKTFSPMPHLECTAVALPWRNADRIRAGDILVLKAAISPYPPTALFSYGASQRRRGISGQCSVIAASRPLRREGDWFTGAHELLTERLRRVVVQETDAALLLSMGLGERDILPGMYERAFKQTGLAHLLVVSGFQVTLLFLTLRGIVRYLGALLYRWGSSRYIEVVSCSAGILGALFFLFWTVGEGPTLRATLAALFFMITKLFDRGGSSWNAILFALFVMCLLFPGSFLEPGVQLTFAALCGLALFPGRGFVRALLATECATLFTSVVAALWFNSFTIAAFVLNPLIAPIISLICCHLGYCAILLHLGELDPQGVLIRTVSEALRVVADLVLWVSSIEGLWWELKGTEKFLLLAVLLVCSWGAVCLARRLPMASDVPG